MSPPTSKENLTSVNRFLLVGGLIGIVNSVKDGLFSSSLYRSIFSQKEISSGKILSITFKRYSWGYAKIIVPYSQNSIKYKEGAFIINVNDGSIFLTNIKNFDLECKYKANSTLSTLYIKSLSNTTATFYISGSNSITIDAFNIDQFDDFPSDANAVKEI